MSVKERLIKFAKSQERSVRAFENKAGLGYGYINSIRVSIQPDKIKSIASNYPILNIDWLLTGDGKMLNIEAGKDDKNHVVNEPVAEIYGKTNIIIPREVFDMLNKLTDTVQSQHRLIEADIKLIKASIFKNSDQKTN